MRRHRILIFATAALAATLWTHGCGDGGTEPPTPDPPRPTTVTVTPAMAELTAIGATVQLAAQVLDQNGQAMAGAAVTWSSSAASVATVDGSGLVTAAGNGAATITAKAGGVSGTAMVTVAQVVTSVTVLRAADTLFAGDTLRLAAEATDANGHAVTDAEFSWSSSDTLVATVDTSGLVLAVAYGTATVTATAGDASGSAVVVVRIPPPTVSIATTHAVAPEGGSVSVEVLIEPPPDSTVTITYTIGSDEDVETHDADTLDYSDPRDGTIEFEAGATRAALEIAINDDDDIEPAREVFALSLDEPGEATKYIRGDQHTAEVTIEEGVCDRTPEVQDEILRQSGFSGCTEPDPDDLARITRLWTPPRKATPPTCLIRLQLRPLRPTGVSGASLSQTEKMTTPRGRALTDASRDPDRKPRAS